MSLEPFNEDLDVDQKQIMVKIQITKSTIVLSLYFIFCFYSITFEYCHGSHLVNQFFACSTEPQSNNFIVMLGSTVSGRLRTEIEKEHLFTLYNLHAEVEE